MVVMDRLSAYETGLLADLSGDVGVSLWEWDGLFERCDRCGRYFVASWRGYFVSTSRTAEAELCYIPWPLIKKIEYLFSSHIGDWGR
jgi:hypothetical protein